MADQRGPRAGHVEKTVQSLIDVHREHERRVSHLQLGIERSTRFLARPAVIMLGALAVAAWIGGNQWFARRGGAVDPPPFAGLELAATLAALLLSALILATQRREQIIETRRSQLTLELALLNDQKTAKLIALMEELRRDSPSIQDRVDDESQEMSSPADAREMLETLDREGVGDPN